MQVRSTVAAYFGENTYLLSDAQTGQAVLIDPGSPLPLVVQWIEEEHLTVTDILLTHAHVDHIAGVPYFRQKYLVPVWLSEKERDVLENSIRSYPQVLGDLREKLQPDHWIHEGDCLTPFQLKVLETPGHTHGSVVYQSDNALFTGDTLFFGSVGRMDLFSGSESDMKKSLRKLFSLPEDYIVYPGHDIPTTLKQERSINPYVRYYLQDEE